MKLAGLTACVLALAACAPLSAADNVRAAAEKGVAAAEANLVSADANAVSADANAVSADVNAVFADADLVAIHNDFDATHVATCTAADTLLPRIAVDSVAPAVKKAAEAVEKTAKTVTDSAKVADDAAKVATDVAKVAVKAADTAVKAADTAGVVASGDSLAADTAKFALAVDSIMRGAKKQKTPRPKFVPDPNRALWLALILPGAGQIYNRKYWKLPIFYGGFLGCTYALMWNQQMYKDYAQAYIDIMDDDPNTHSYLDMLPPNYDISGMEDRFKTIFKNKKDRYRRWRDLSAFAFVGVYLLSVIDAYVDAQLSVFDISKDLSLNVGPTVIPVHDNPYKPAVGVGCALNF